MTSPLSITPKKEKEPIGCCFGKPKKNHEKTKEKVAKLSLHASDDLPLSELFDSEKVRQMTDAEIADLLNTKHRRMPTPYPRDEKK